MRPSLAETSMAKISSRNHSRSSSRSRISKMANRRSHCHVSILVHSLAIVLALCHSQSQYFKCNAFTTLPSFSIVKIQKYNTIDCGVDVGGSLLYANPVGGSRRHSASPDIVDIDEDVNDANDKHHHQHPHTTRNRRDFVVQSIAAASTVVMSMTPPFADWAIADHETETPSSTSSSTTIIDPAIQMPTITQKIYLDIKFEKYVEPKRLVIGLFGKDLPKTVENFAKLCTSENGASYVGSTFYRVLSENSIQGGAIGSPNNDGSIGTSAYDNGKPFLPDNYNIRHTVPGLVSAVRANNEGYIDSRFFVQTESDAGWADGRYAAFGIVLDEEEEKKGVAGENGGGSGGGGMDLVRRISRVDVTRPRNSPKESVTIVGCGVL